MSETDRWSVRVVGRGVVTTVNDKALLTREEAEEAAAAIHEITGDTAKPERLLLDVPLAGHALIPPIPQPKVET
jgi:hypothetical protein